MRLMRPCATVLRKIFPYSIPGRRRVCTYSARPVTLSHDSSRGTERPTCGVSVACVARFMDCPREIHAKQLPLVVGRAVQVAFDLQAIDRRFAGKTRRPVGGRADENSVLLAQQDSDPDGGPVVSRTRGALQIRGAPLAERRDFHARDELASLQRILEIPGVELLDRQGPRCLPALNGDAR